MGATTRSVLRHLTPERGFDLIRIYLGAGLAVRGILFLRDPSWIGDMVHVNMARNIDVARSSDIAGSSAVALGGSMWPQIIAIGHLAGGLLLAAGLFTRVAAAVQVLPVLGAVVMLHLRDDLATENQSLEFSALVLVMLIFFACFGSGEWSLDRQRQMRQLHRASTARADQRA